MTTLPPAGVGDVVYLLDLMLWVHRCYHAAPPEMSASGEPCAITRAVCRMLVRLLLERDPALLAVAVDRPGPTFRHELYPGYKAGRKPLPDDALHQVERILQVVRLHRIPVLDLEGFEADDLLASATRQALALGFRVVVVAQDKDLTQLCSERVVLWEREKPVVGPDEVRARWGVGPELLGDLLALAGDRTDGVPGVPGIGPKIAAELLTRRGSLDDVLAKPFFARTAKQREALKRHALDARISRELVGLRSDAPVVFDPLECRVGGYDVQCIQATYLDLGMPVLASEVGPCAKAWRAGAPAALVEAR